MYDMSIAADPFNPQHVLVMDSQFHSSTDGLTTISAGAYQQNGNGTDALAITFDPSTSNVVYIGSDQGAKKSTDGGTNWKQFDIGVIASKALGGSNYAVGSDGSIYDNPQDYGGQRLIPGFGWVANPGYETKIDYVNPQDPGDVYNCCYSVVFSGLNRLPTNAYAGGVIDPAPSENNPSNSSFEFDQTDSSGNTLYFGKQSLYKSTDRGKTWANIKSDTGINFVKVAPSNGSYVYTMNFTAAFLSYSTDGGGTWTQGFSLGNIGSINYMAVSPTIPTTLYVATSNGLYQSIDDGKSLVQVTGFPSVNAQYVVIDPANGYIYVSLGNESNVLVSQDGGNSWLTVGTQSGQVAGAGGIAQGWMAVQGGKLYLATSAGIYAIPTTAPASGVCSEMTMYPSSLTVPSGAGT